jgi:hypothetical protein
LTSEIRESVCPGCGKGFVSAYEEGVSYQPHGSRYSFHGGGDKGCLGPFINKAVEEGTGGMGILEAERKHWRQELENERQHWAKEKARADALVRKIREARKVFQMTATLGAPHSNTEGYEEARTLAVTQLDKILEGEI